MVRIPFLCNLVGHHAKDGTNGHETDAQNHQVLEGTFYVLLVFHDFNDGFDVVALEVFAFQLVNNLFIRKALFQKFPYTYMQGIFLLDGYV